MEHKMLIAHIPLKVWDAYERALLYAYPDYSAEERMQYTAFALANTLADFTRRIEESSPYQTLPVEGGWNVFFIEDGKEPRLNDTHPEPFSKKQKSNADRLRKSLNRKWHKADRDIEAIMDANNGALVI